MTTTPPIPPPELFCLPAAYQQQNQIQTHDEFSTELYWNPARIASSAMYQHHVYKWAARLISENNIQSVLDIGCGPATKLAKMITPLCIDITGVDLPHAIEVARSLNDQMSFQTADIETKQALPHRTFDLIICADVIEHVADPRILLDSIRAVCHARTLVLLSTPDRHRLRGRRNLQSPMKEHIREWSVAEFQSFLTQEGFTIQRTRLLHFGDGNNLWASATNMLFQLRLVQRSPLRCQAVLCSLPKS